MYVCMYVCVYICVYMHGIEHRFWFQNGAINAYVDPFWLDLGVTFGAFSVHFDITLGVLGGSPAILAKSFPKNCKESFPSSILRHLGAQVGATWSEDGGQEHQDEPT